MFLVLGLKYSLKVMYSIKGPLLPNPKFKIGFFKRFRNIDAISFPLLTQ